MSAPGEQIRHHRPHRLVEPPRVVPWMAVLGWHALTLGPAVLARVRDAPDATATTVGAAVLLGASLASALDDPAEVTLASASVTVVRRRLERTVLALLAACAASVLVGVLAAGRTPGLDLEWLLAIASATALVALAATARIGRSGSSVSAGLAGSAVGVMVVLTSTAIAQQYPRLPSLLDPGDTASWWVVAGLAAFVALPILRDPCSPTLRLRARRALAGHTAPRVEPVRPDHLHR